ncbi:NDP-hexose 2,3-dehydratase family protein [Streptomyces albidoflavus]|uniref:NDP-hexose 2,3-dehydratase family protein n=1 Tax=Streptomyces albidoflavus TaxID=1886 RepID=UPI0034561815
MASRHRPGERAAADRLSGRLARSAAVRTGQAGSLDAFHRWFAGQGERSYTETETVPLEELDRWSRGPGTDGLAHDSGRFFRVRGIDVQAPDAVVPHWRQPIIDQPETGILGILVTEFDGVPHFLMQAKAEPGNLNGLQLSPTVQATRSNYLGVHGGRSVPYMEYFRDAARRTVVADVRQSEQGAWFYRKRNRNMIVEVHEAVEVLDGFRWLTLGQIHALLRQNDLVNMDSRSVLACLPPARPAPLRGEDGVAQTDAELLSWITEMRSGTDVRVQVVPLDEVTGWHATDGRLRHESGLFFDVVGVRVRARGREVAAWSQPMIAARTQGVIAFLVRRTGGTPQVLVQARAQPGYVDGVELAPTVQCVPENYGLLPSAARPPFLDDVLRADARRVLFDTVLSEEGGRFHHTRNRHVVVEVDEEWSGQHPGFRWVAVDQLAGLLRHSYYLNVEARSLVTCLRSVI